MRRLAPCGLGGDRGAELRHGAPDFAPNRKDFKHQGQPEHLLWVHVNCQELLTDPNGAKLRRLCDDCGFG